jgi:hypothetical protein
MIVTIEVKDPVHATIQAKGGEDGLIGQVTGAVRRLRPGKQEFSFDAPPEYSNEVLKGFSQELAAIDERLFVNLNQPALWKERAGLNFQLRQPISGLVSLLTGSLLDTNFPAFLRSVSAYARRTPDWAPLFEESVSTMRQGKLLSTIREKGIPAEIHFALSLAYAYRFSDPEIFRQAIDSMRTGYLAEKRMFHGFGSGDPGSQRTSGCKVGLLTAKDLPRIRANVNNFLLRLGGAEPPIIAIVRKQFIQLLSHHLSPELARRLVPPFDPFGARDARGNMNEVEIIQKFFQLDAWPAYPGGDHAPESTRRWFDLLTMARFQEISLSDMFTGELYKSAFFFYHQTPQEGQELAEAGWMGDLVSQLPESSDGRLLAQAIYQRFSEGKSDWDIYFRKAQGRSTSLQQKARSQRVLLFLVTEFGPFPEFEPFIEPLTVTVESNSVWDIFALTLFCDLFRLSLAFRQPVDEQRLFMALLNRLPQPPQRWKDFRDAAEQLILCLFLNGTPARRFQLDNMLVKSLEWFREAYRQNDATMLDELLTIMSFLEIGVLTDLVPATLQNHQFQERSRMIWIESARHFAGENGWQTWNGLMAKSSG